MAASQPMCRCQVDGWLHRPPTPLLAGTPFWHRVGAKRLELLRWLAPKATTIAVLVNPSPDAEDERRDVQAAAQQIGQQLIILDVNSDRDIEAAFATFVERGADALFVSTSAFMISNRERASSYAAGQLCCARDRRGQWLMSYGTSLTDALRQVGVYTGRILRGEKPADLPVQNPTKYEAMAANEAVEHDRHDVVSLL
jgi:putative ABC transport system substrate-binding protein